MTQTFILEEFRLELPAKWKEYPYPESGTLLLQSDEDRASLIITTQLIDTPLEKAEGAADTNIRARIEAHKAQYPKLQLIEATIAAHSSGAALEMFYAVAAPDEAVLMYIGFLTPRKVQSALLVCGPDTTAAADLFRQTLRDFQPKIP
ncbi:hypothetical protein J2W32_000659 [Variovorax boronicumulans]|uniref:DUF1795 domain-containing protein n=1 Tax=Variovorax boronicumulans TaxID=436515 RepID=A0AAW8CMM9_9BURK|nr:hypothetical protein [Variovorax boronicumulans]MDP9891562.1 hypothetical protein [Variovorax boronicumulans]MDP9991527.1 hypothetical protein [Variovorax boronicumulans]MDQ0003555.1 hypothetical protein [Variovorax boronicumulans]MDQ0035113.1 hypothetical protein [Variovorax boronicumulans]MDQ0040647.1 hypothetical protein [Variovorax boronicumulans]